MISRKQTGILLLLIGSAALAYYAMTSLEQASTQRNQHSIPAPVTDTRPEVAPSSPSMLQQDRLDLAREMYATATQEQAAAQTALNAIEQRMDELESQLDALEAQGEDLTQHQDKTQPVFQQLLSDYQQAMQRLDNADAAVQESQYEIEELERQR